MRNYPNKVKAHPLSLAYSQGGGKGDKQQGHLPIIGDFVPDNWQMPANLRGWVGKKASE